MPLFRKRPVVIEAVQFTGGNTVEVVNFIGSGYRVMPDYRDASKDVIFIVTLEGEMVATAGDWIIRGVQGEFYPCKPDIFEATYELEEN